MEGLEFSPGFVKTSQALGEDYAFDGMWTGPIPRRETDGGKTIVDNQAAIDSQRSDMNLITLERNSFNFLE
jgi:hypothetical protein